MSGFADSRATVVFRADSSENLHRALQAIYAHAKDHSSGFGSPISRTARSPAGFASVGAADRILERETKGSKNEDYGVRLAALEHSVELSRGGKSLIKAVCRGSRAAG
jgi:hypothetical protein